MARFTTLAALELKRRLRDPVSLIAWLAIPFLMVTLMVVVFGGKGGSSLPTIELLAVNHDDGFLSKALLSALDSPQLAKYMEVTVLDEDEAARRMDRGGASLMLVIPKGFTRGFLDDKPLTLELHRNPEQTILPGIGEEILSFLADAGGLLRATLLPLTRGVIDFDASTRPSLAQVTELSTTIYRIMDDPTARAALSFNSLKITARHPEKKKRTRSEVVGWFAPGFIALALLFLCNGQSQEIQEDLIHGRLARAWTFPSAPSLALGAKAAALVLSATASAALLVAALAGALGWRPGNWLVLLLHTLAVAAAFSGLSLLLRSLTRNPEAGGAAATGVMVGLGFLGGCFIPAVFLPPFLRGVALYIPTGWAVQGYLILQGSSWAGPLGAIGWRIGALAATGAVSFLLAGRLMERRAAA
ncbi:MAG TPA: ABC-2 transporter permease [Acidobacteria bacterium]|nr:ABC-2 transporter permease [Acidobacteriota bacterium]